MAHEEFRFSREPKGSNPLFYAFSSLAPPSLSCKQGTGLSACLVPACGCTLHPQTTLCFRHHALIAPKIEGKKPGGGALQAKGAQTTCLEKGTGKGYNISPNIPHNILGEKLD